MKALTIQQPYPSLILLPDDDLRRKRIENRMWKTWHRGPLLIHAGKSRARIRVAGCLPDGSETDEYGLVIADMPFGAIVGVANVVDCIDSGDPRDVRRGCRAYPWLSTHEHAERGMFWWVLQNVLQFPQPIRYKGAQGLFEVPVGVVSAALEAVGWRDNEVPK